MDKLLCGIDLGGTKLAAALFDTGGKLVDRELTHDHVCESPDGIVAVAARLVASLLERWGLRSGDLEGVGVGVTGHVSSREGLIITSSNFKADFRRYPLARNLGDRLPGLRIVVDNDANAQALGEATYGAGRGYESVVFITVSTGIGAGIVLGGRLLRGRSGTAGELGHCIIDHDSRQLCTCGNYGCAMALASGAFLPGLYAEKLRSGMRSCIDIDEDNVDRMCGELLARGISCEDEPSIAVMRDSADAVGTAVFNTFQLINPHAIVLGGGLMKLGEPYMGRIKERFAFLVKSMMYEEMEIKLSELGDLAGLLGAASLLREGS